MEHDPSVPATASFLPLIDLVSMPDRIPFTWYDCGNPQIKRTAMLAKHGVFGFESLVSQFTWSRYLQSSTWDSQCSRVISEIPAVKAALGTHQATARGNFT